MRVRELAERAAVPVPTIKLYIREGLLPRGDKSAKNAAVYGPVHVERLRLIGLLQDLAALSLPAIRELLAAHDELAGWPRERARAAVVALVERAGRIIEASAPAAEGAPRRAPLGPPDRAWLLARGLEEPGEAPDRLHDALAGFRDSRLARALALDLEDIEPAVKIAQEQARFEVGLLDRIARMDGPLGERLALALEALVLWPAITRGLTARWRASGARRLLGG